MHTPMLLAVLPPERHHCAVATYKPIPGWGASLLVNVSCCCFYCRLKRLPQHLVLLEVKPYHFFVPSVPRSLQGGSNADVVQAMHAGSEQHWCRALNLNTAVVPNRPLSILHSLRFFTHTFASKGTAATLLCHIICRQQQPRQTKLEMLANDRKCHKLWQGGRQA